MIYSKIAGTGSYLPEKIMTNADIAERVETSNDWIVERTGIKRRHIAAKDETAATMAEMAAKNAITAANLSPDDIDFIIVATATPDHVFPSVACLLQQRLNISSCPAFDIVAACTGFIYGLSIADQFIKAGIYKNVLVVASEIMSRLIDWDDRKTCILFGDGAGAVVLQASESPGILSTHLHADGNYKDLLWVPGFFTGEKEKEHPPFIRMQGNEVFRLAVNYLSKVVDEALEANGLSSDKIDWLVPHQANYRIIQAIAKKLNLPLEKVILTVAEQGNTSAASIPLALDTAVRSHKIKRGDHVLLEAFGAGLTWGSALLVY